MCFSGQVYGWEEGMFDVTMRFWSQYLYAVEVHCEIHGHDALLEVPPSALSIRYPCLQV
jgi:hypothetical protein